MDDKKSLLTTLPPLLVAVGTLITAVIGLGNFMSSPEPSVAEFDVSPSIIDAGGNATLKWTVSGEASSVSIDPNIGTVALSGSRQISPANTTNYTLTAKNKGQVKMASAQLIVRAGKAAQSGIQKSDISSIEKSDFLSAPSLANNVGDEPAHNEVPTGMDVAKNANIINTTNTIENAGKDKSAISNEYKPSKSYGKDTGDEPLQMSITESASKSKETTGRTNASGNINVGDEPIQMTEPKSTNVKNASGTFNAINQTMPTIAAAATTTTKAPTTIKTQSGVGDIA